MAAILFVVLGGVWGSGAGGVLGGGAGLDNPHGESSQANSLLAGTLGRHVADVVVMYESQAMDVDDPRFKAQVEAVVRQAAQGTPTSGWESYYSTGSADFVSADRHKTLPRPAAPRRRRGGAGRRLQPDPAAVRRARASPSVFGRADRGGASSSTRSANRDLARAELLSFPLLIILLLIVFRSLVAAALPLAIAVLVAVGSLVVLRIVGGLVDLSTAAINVVVILGLGLATDYALLIVNRFREELAAGREVEDAVVRATAHGRPYRRGLRHHGRGHARRPDRLPVPVPDLAGLRRGVAVVLFAGDQRAHRAARAASGGRPPHRLAAHPAARAARPETEGTRWYRTAHGVMRRAGHRRAGHHPRAGPRSASRCCGAVWTPPGRVGAAADTDSVVVTRQLAEEFPYDPTEGDPARSCACPGPRGHAGGQGPARRVRPAAATGSRASTARR
ncbi:MMPL family transporter [Nonomuraea rubra]|uniref:MMPL family transporter n=1 Tax=Nonomuraea rubra TaxID=46180 RepID=UPI0031EA34B0